MLSRVWSFCRMLILLITYMAYMTAILAIWILEEGDILSALGRKFTGGHNGREGRKQKWAEREVVFRYRLKRLSQLVLNSTSK